MIIVKCTRPVGETRNGEKKYRLYFNETELRLLDGKRVELQVFQDGERTCLVIVPEGYGDD